MPQFQTRLQGDNDQQIQCGSFQQPQAPKPAVFSKPGENGKKRSKGELEGTELFIHNKNQNAA